MVHESFKGPAPGIARPTERLSIPPAMVECLATARSSVEVTNSNTITMTQELPEKKSTIQGQAAGIARPAEGLSITTAMTEKNKDAKEDMPVVLPAIPDVYNLQMKATVEPRMMEE